MDSNWDFSSPKLRPPKRREWCGFRGQSAGEYSGERRWAVAVADVRGKVRVGKGYTLFSFFSNVYFVSPGQDGSKFNNRTTSLFFQVVRSPMN